MVRCRATEEQPNDGRAVGQQLTACCLPGHQSQAEAAAASERAAEAAAAAHAAEQERRALSDQLQDAAAAADEGLRRANAELAAENARCATCPFRLRLVLPRS